MRHLFFCLRCRLFGGLNCHGGGGSGGGNGGGGDDSGGGDGEKLWNGYISSSRTIVIPHSGEKRLHVITMVVVVVVMVIVLVVVMVRNCGIVTSSSAGAGH